MRRALLTFAVCAGAFGASAAAAQQFPGRVGGGIAYEYFSFSSPEEIGIESLSLITVPAGVRLRLADPLTLDVGAAWARGKLVRDDGSEATISGPTDTQLRLELALGRDLVTLSGVALLPTGSESLSFDEADVAGLIAADVLPFRISNWGTGGGVGLSAAVARPVGSFAAGVSVGYVVAREFEPLTEDAFTYRPGNELSVRAAIDRTFGSAGKAALVLSMQRFDIDQVDGTNLFRSGRRYEARGSYAFAASAGGAGILFLGYLHRDESRFLSPIELLAAQDLIFGGAGFELRSGSILIRPNADVRVLRRDDGVGQGYTATGGAEVEIPTGALTLVPRLRGRFGNVLVREGAESGFSGFDAGLAIRFGPRNP